jgi:hypothetical protein
LLCLFIYRDGLMPAELQVNLTPKSRE